MKNLGDYIILDTGSTIPATFMNPDFVTDIKVSDNPLHMRTNAGSTIVNLEAEVMEFGKAYYDPDQMANILGFGNLTDNVESIKYDSTKEDAFVITHTDKSTTKFTRTKEGLYAYKPSPEFLQEVKDAKDDKPPPLRRPGKKKNRGERDIYWQRSFLVSSVKENRMGYTQREFNDAKIARRLLHIVGNPTIPNFKGILRQNIIKNCPVTPKHVDIAEDIFGPDIGAMKGKKTRPKPPRVIEDIVEIPPELIERHHDLTLCMDLTFVNGMPMFTAIDIAIRYRSLVPIENRSVPELLRALDVILRHYNKAGFFVTTVRSDREFMPIMDEIQDDLEISMNYTAADEHT